MYNGRYQKLKYDPTLIYFNELKRCEYKNVPSIDFDRFYERFYVRRIFSENRIDQNKNHASEDGATGIKKKLK